VGGREHEAVVVDLADPQSNSDGVDNPTNESTDVCFCDDGQFWDVVRMDCSSCPKNYYSGTAKKSENTLFKGTVDEALFYGHRTTCTPCPEFTVSASGSVTKQDCKEAFTLLSSESDKNGFCSRSAEGIPLVPILDADECLKAAEKLKLAVPIAGSRLPLATVVFLFPIRKEYNSGGPCVCNGDMGPCRALVSTPSSRPRSCTWLRHTRVVMLSYP